MTAAPNWEATAAAVIRTYLNNLALIQSPTTLPPVRRHAEALVHTAIDTAEWITTFTPEHAGQGWHRALMVLVNYRRAVAESGAPETFGVSLPTAETLTERSAAARSG